MFEDGSIKAKPLVYLAGSIMEAKDGGVGWRADITPHLDTLGYQIFNPVFDQPRISGISKDSLLSLQKTDIVKYHEAATKIVDTDLTILNKASLLLVKIDEGVLKGSGTFGELTVAHMRGIPVFAWIDLPKGVFSVPSWAFGCVNYYTVQEREFYKMIPTAKALREAIQKEHDSYDNWLSDT